MTIGRVRCVVFENNSPHPLLVLLRGEKERGRERQREGERGKEGGIGERQRKRGEGGRRREKRAGEQQGIRNLTCILSTRVQSSTPRSHS